MNFHWYSRFDSPKLRQNFLCGQGLSLHRLLSRKMGKERMFLQPEILACWLESSLPSQSLHECHLVSSSSPPELAPLLCWGGAPLEISFPPPCTAMLATLVLALQNASLSTLLFPKPLFMGTFCSLFMGIFPISDVLLSD